MPDPREPTFGAQAARCIRRVLDITRGRAFCLFTSYQQMRDLYERLLPELDYPCLLQGTAPRKALLEEFRNTPTPCSSEPRRSGRGWMCRAKH
jgi:ATP-dependent DNA helicase DinG